jgi:hypothetical protein
VLNSFNIIKDITNRPDFHSLFLFFPGEGKAEKKFYFPQQFNGIDTIKTMVIPEVVIQARLVKFKIFGKNRQDFIFKFISGHNRKRRTRKIAKIITTYIITITVVRRKVESDTTQFLAISKGNIESRGQRGTTGDQTMNVSM